MQKYAESLKSIVEYEIQFLERYVKFHKKHINLQGSYIERFPFF